MRLQQASGDDGYHHGLIGPQPVVTLIHKVKQRSALPGAQSDCLAGIQRRTAAKSDYPISLCRVKHRNARSDLAAGGVAFYLTEYPGPQTSGG
jgi:hypothetical protein